MTGKLIAFPLDASETTSRARYGDAAYAQPDVPYAHPGAATRDDRSRETASYEAPTLARPRPARASLASELRPLRRARTERDDGARGERAPSVTPPRGSEPLPSRAPSADLSSRPRPSAVVPIARTADDSREMSGEIDTAARRDPPTMGERIRAEAPRPAGPFRELGASASPPEPDARHTRKPAIRVLVGGRVTYVGWV